MSDLVWTEHVCLILSGLNTSDLDQGEAIRHTGEGQNIVLWVKNNMCYKQFCERLASRVY